MTNPSRTGNAHLAIAYVALRWGTRLSVDLIRTWAHRGHVARRGTDQWGHALYDLDDIERRARTRGLLDPELHQ